MAVIIRRYYFRNITGTSGPAERYISSFTATDWTLEGADYTISVSSAQHGRGQNPSVKVYVDNSGSFEEVETAVTIDTTGNVKIYISTTPDNRFSGKIILI